MVTDHDIARWRLANQRLSAPHWDTAADVVGGLLAVQAENRGQAGWAVAARTAHPDAAELDRLLADGAVVRTHVLRPTWHFVAAADIGWLLELTAPRVRPVLLRQLTDLGWTGEEVDRAAAVVLELLGATPDRDRGELAAALAERGFAVGGQAMMLLLGVLELDRLVCSGRERAGTHTYARYADRVPPARRLDRDEALGEIAHRYVAGHGPATERDLAYWATLTLTGVRRGLDACRERLASFTHDGRTYWHVPDSVAPTGPPEPAAHLLQLLDETYRGYQDSRMVLDVAGVVPRGREAAIGMALVDAQLVGSMRRRTGARVRFEVTPYRRLARGEVAALKEAAGRYGRYLGLPHELLVLG